MDNEECIAFLQWMAPRLHMRWQGFRRVRKRVCRRIQRRIHELQLDDSNAYRDYLLNHNEEWRVLDELSRVVVTRFYRDRKIFDSLYQEVLPRLAEEIKKSGKSTLRIWSIGCASGEEIYSILLCWSFLPETIKQGIRLELLATDSDAHLLQRGREACYDYATLKVLPPDWITKAFKQRGDLYCLHDKYIKQVNFQQHDIRTAIEFGRFHLILCRNLVFTYYDTELQKNQLAKLSAALHANGVLVTGARERLPEEQVTFLPLEGCRGIYLKKNG